MDFLLLAAATVLEQKSPGWCRARAGGQGPREVVTVSVAAVPEQLRVQGPGLPPRECRVACDKGASHLKRSQVRGMDVCRSRNL